MWRRLGDVCTLQNGSRVCYPDAASAAAAGITVSQNDTSSAVPISIPPDGSLISVIGSAFPFLILNGQKRMITDGPTLSALGLSWKNALRIDAATFNSIPLGAPLTMANYKDAFNYGGAAAPAVSPTVSPVLSTSGASTTPSFFPSIGSVDTSSVSGFVSTLPWYGWLAIAVAAYFMFFKRGR